MNENITGQSSIGAGIFHLDVPSTKTAGVKSLSEFLIKVAASEFVIVASVAYITSGLYHNTLLESWSSAPKYLGAALFIATMVLLVSIGFRHFTAIQIQQRHVFLWNGIGAVVLAFSFLLSTMFLLKLTDEYSRVTFVFQFVCVTLAVLCVRAISYERLRSSVASGLMEARRVILFGDAIHCSQVADRLKSFGVRSVGTFPFPADPDIGAAAGVSRDARTMIDLCRTLNADDILVLDPQDRRSITPHFVSLFIGASQRAPYRARGSHRTSLSVANRRIWRRDGNASVPAAPLGDRSGS